MKTLVLSLSTGLLLAGCSKKGDYPAPAANPGGNLSTVTATVSGAADFLASGLNDIDGL